MRNHDADGRRLLKEGSSAADEFALELSAARPIRVLKTVALITSRDPAVASPAEAATDRLRWLNGDPR